MSNYQWALKTVKKKFVKARGQLTKRRMMKVITTALLMFALFAIAQAGNKTGKKNRRNKWDRINTAIDDINEEIKDMKNRMLEVKATCGCEDEPIKPVCPDGWSEFQDSCFLFVETELNWDAAMDNCRNLAVGGHLAEIYDRKTDMFLFNMSSQVQNPNHQGGPWFGANDKEKEGDWIWATSGKKMSYQNWNEASNEPNGDTGENCLHVLRFDAEGWNDVSCTGYTSTSICETAK